MTEHASAPIKARERPLVVQYLAEYPSATETFVVELLRAVKSHRQEVWTQRANRAVASALSVREIGSGSRGVRAWTERLQAVRHGFELREQLRLSRRLQTATRPDLVHAHFGPQGFAAAEPCRRLGIPLVTTFYGYDIGIAERSPVWRRRYSSLWRAGAAFLVEGPYMRQQLIRLGAPEATTHIQRLPLDPSTVQFRPRSLLPMEPLRLIQVARLIEKKGVDLAIQAVGTLRKHGHDISLDIVGDGPLRYRLERQVLASDLGAAVRFRGLVSHDSVRRLLEDAHLLVQPSRTASSGDTEGGAPYVLLEAQASGMCVIASAHADIPNTVAPEAWFGFAENDSDGLAAAIEVAAAVASEWPDRARAARRFVERHHDAHKLASALGNMYGALTATRPPGNR